MVSVDLVRSAGGKQGLVSEEGVSTPEFSRSPRN